jgi:WD40 repeat protein
LEGHIGKVCSVAFSPNGMRIASGSADGTIRLWDALTGQPIGPAFRGHRGWVASTAPFPHSSRVTSASLDGTVRIWDRQTHHQIGDPLVSNVEGLIYISVSPDETRIAAATASGSIYLWDTESRKLISRTESSVSTIISLKFSSIGSELIVACIDGSVSRWNAKDGKLIRASVSHGNLISGHDRVVSFDTQRGWQGGESETGVLHWSPSEDPDVGLWAYADGMLIRSDGPDSVTIFDVAGHLEKPEQQEAVPTLVPDKIVSRVSYCNSAHC